MYFGGIFLIIVIGKKNDENPYEVSAISFIIIGSEPKSLNKKKFRCLQIQIRTLN